jgi:transcriptional regulator with XRE-family HTH domain
MSRLTVTGQKKEFVDKKETICDFLLMSYIPYDMTKSSAPKDLTPKHVRAARALLAWSQQDLAKAADVATSTVADFERGKRTPVANNAQAIRGALEGAGIQFLSSGAVIGPALPTIAASDRPAAPVRWVSAEDLSDWANRTDGAVSLPTLLAYLIQASHNSQVRLRFPSDEGIRHPGWDGRDRQPLRPQGGRGLGNRRPAQQHRPEGKRGLP